MSLGMGGVDGLRGTVMGTGHGVGMEVSPSLR